MRLQLSVVMIVSAAVALLPACWRASAADWSGCEPDRVYDFTDAALWLSCDRYDYEYLPTGERLYINDVLAAAIDGCYRWPVSKAVELPAYDLPVGCIVLRWSQRDYDGIADILMNVRLVDSDLEMTELYSGLRLDYAPGDCGVIDVSPDDRSTTRRHAVNLSNCNLHDIYLAAIEVYLDDGTASAGSVLCGDGCSPDAVWFTLDGLRLASEPVSAGLYVVATSDGASLRVVK